MPRRIRVSFPEEDVLLDDERVAQRLRGAGVRIAFDDFGTGWSSLSYLSKFPVDLIKLDPTFTAELGRTAGADTIPATIIHPARGLSLVAIAEGVDHGAPGGAHGPC